MQLLPVSKLIINILGLLFCPCSLFVVSPERGHIVDIKEFDTSLMLQTKKGYRVEWQSDKLLPIDLPINSSSLNVNVYIYYLKYTLQQNSEWVASWEKVTSEPLQEVEVENSEGRVSIKLPSSNNKCQFPLESGIIDIGLCPIVVKVSVKPEQDEQLSFRLSSSIGIWSGIAFLLSDNTDGQTLRLACESWGDSEENFGRRGLNDVLSCPPTVGMAQSDARYELEIFQSVFGQTKFAKQSTDFFHPKAGSCYIQSM